MKPVLSTRQAEVAALVAKGAPVKIIARDTGLAVKTVRNYIHTAAAKIPGHTPPRHKLTLWVYGITSEE